MDWRRPYSKLFAGFCSYSQAQKSRLSFGTDFYGFYCCKLIHTARYRSVPFSGHKNRGIFLLLVAVRSVQIVQEISFLISDCVAMEIIVVFAQIG
jgi:hypothetical protein